MFSLIENYSKKFKKEEQILKNLSSGNFKFFGVPRGANSFLSCVLGNYFSKETLVIVSPFNNEAELLFREALSFLPPDDLIFLPGNEAIPYEHTHYSPEIKRDRIKALSAILNQKKKLIFASVSGILQTVPPKDLLESKSITIKKGKQYKQQDLIKKLIEAGYRREDVCEVFGDFSVKGEILDVFSPFSNLPIRIDFFDDEVESIKIFDPESQKSMGEVKETT
ncbi:MAG: transcription-repair coupling factor, partial [Leptospiraceae bacterium]|nr:transcription-repair coupling factor [Leptospiraceae bacterium]